MRLFLTCCKSGCELLCAWDDVGVPDIEAKQGVLLFRNFGLTMQKRPENLVIGNNKKQIMSHFSSQTYASLSVWMVGYLISFTTRVSRVFG